MKPESYEEAGVSVSRGDAFARYIATRTSPAVGAIGGFAGGVEIDPKAWRRPIMLSTTDGVGTKLLIAREFDAYDRIGIDLVAMCVNDLAVCGAQPQSFLDYIACAAIDAELLQRVIDGVILGCEAAGCTLAGGETAEMPDLYAPGDIDLAGFAVGLVEADEMLPRTNLIEAGDVLAALPSSGIHSNGLSLARKVLDSDDPARRLLIEPTRIYVAELMRARAHIKAAAHITGGGIEANVARVVPPGLVARFTWDWRIPEVFTAIQAAGSLADSVMHGAFNMGLGIVMIVSPRQLEALERALGSSVLRVGSIGIAGDTAGGTGG